MTLHWAIFGLQSVTILLLLRHDILKHVKSVSIVLKNGKDKTEGQ
jgi:hypothetical protein